MPPHVQGFLCPCNQFVPLYHERSLHPKLAEASTSRKLVKYDQTYFKPGDMRKQKGNSFGQYYGDINDVDDPTAPRVKEAAIEENKALIAKVKDLELKNSVLQLTYQSHVHGYCATTANFDTILKNVGAPDDNRKNILDSLSGLRWNQKIAKIDIPTLRKEFWYFGLEVDEMFDLDTDKGIGN